MHGGWWKGLPSACSQDRASGPHQVNSPLPGILPCSSLTWNSWPQSPVFFLSFVPVTVPPDLVDTDSTLGASLGDQTVKNLPKMQETQVWSVDQEDPPRGGHGNPLQYSYLENLMDRGGWWATVHGVAKTRIQLSDPERTHTHTHTELVHDLGPFCLLTWAMSHGSTGGRFNSSLQFWDLLSQIWPYQQSTRQSSKDQTGHKI